MNSVVPTPDDIKRQKKLMRKIRIADDLDPNTKDPTPRQQKKIDKTLWKIIKKTNKPLGGPIH